MLLSFQNITHELGGNTLFRDVGFSMEDGCLLIVKGPNGSGKTTLLKILAGLMVPKYGFVFEGDKEINEDYRSYCEGLQFLGHRNALDAELTVRENLQFYAKISDGGEALEAVIRFFGMERYLNTPVKYLSAGWRRRVALSRLMLSKSRVWILDEPFSNLDAEMIDITLKMIASFCDQGGKIIMSCHQELNLPFGMELQLTDFAPEV